MKYYEIKINGYGGELVNGKVTKEQYEFWVEQNEETLSHHVFYDPYDETKENLIHDDKDPRFLGYWHDLDDIIHENGADLGSAYIEINEVNKSNARLKDVVENTELQPLLKESQNLCTTKSIDLDDYATYDGHNYIFQGMSIEKGLFFHTILELPDNEKFDFNKLEFMVTECPIGDEIVYCTAYDNHSLDNTMGGDTIGKGISMEVFDY
jgi:hypothetical protein